MTDETKSVISTGLEMFSRWTSLAVIVFAMLYFANGLAEKHMNQRHDEMIKLIEIVGGKIGDEEG